MKYSLTSGSGSGSASDFYWFQRGNDRAYTTITIYIIRITGRPTRNCNTVKWQGNSSTQAEVGLTNKKRIRPLCAERKVNKKSKHQLRK